MDAEPTGQQLSFEDWIGVSAVLYEWAASYDAKDWERLRRAVAPKLLIDYTNVSGQMWDAMPADDYVAMVSDAGFLGDPLLQTQHLVGASRWDKVADDAIVGRHQLRAAHVRFADETRAVEEMKGYAHSSNTHLYKRIDGVWKLAGLRPDVRWNEDEFERVFAGFEAPTRR